MHEPGNSCFKYNCDNLIRNAAGKQIFVSGSGYIIKIFTITAFGGRNDGWYISYTGGFYTGCGYLFFQNNSPSLTKLSNRHKSLAAGCNHFYLHTVKPAIQTKKTITFKQLFYEKDDDGADDDGYSRYIRCIGGG
jgi:hypothetical protein